jgi:hypothetical protein
MPKYPRQASRPQFFLSRRRFAPMPEDDCRLTEGRSLSYRCYLMKYPYQTQAAGWAVFTPPFAGQAVGRPGKNPQPSSASIG